jgi:hypothetical protein
MEKNILIQGIFRVSVTISKCVSAKFVEAFLEKAMYSRPRLLCRRWHQRKNAIRRDAEHSNEAWRQRITRLFIR